MTQHLASVLIALACIALALVGLEIFLSDHQKNKLLGLLLAWWNKLDDLRKTQWLDVLRRYNAQFVLPSFASILVVGFFTWVHLNRSDGDFWSSLQFLLGITIASLAIGIWFIWITLKAKTLFFAVVRVVLLFAIALAPLLVFVGITDLMLPSLKLVEGEVTLVHLAWLLVFVFLFLFTPGLVLSLLAVGVPLAAFLILQGVLFITEFILRRLAEYPKGPMVATTLR